MKFLVWFTLFLIPLNAWAQAPAQRVDPLALAKLGNQIRAYEIDKAYKDDALGLIVIKQGLKAVEKGSGGIGACLINARTQKIVETGQNRQFDGHFRSDLHAEMDLLNRYEERAQKGRASQTGIDPRACTDLILVSSMEPCPMCLTRIINSGIKTVLYVKEDPTGGMVTRMGNLPPFWKAFAADREFKRAHCSPRLRQLAHDLFHLTKRKFAKNRD
ncbi:MAG: deaminase, partial [Desulfovibrionales bacterium]|nr:deaminase [Desulfovibrionales bacterium]